MADISITCQKCNAVTTVSEFVDSAHLKCHACGAQLEKPGGLEQAAKRVATKGSEKPPVKKHNLRLAKREETTSSTGIESSLKDIINPENHADRSDLELRPEAKTKAGVNHAVLAFILFLILGGAMGYLRYGHVLPQNILDYSVQYSWIAVLVLHFIIVIKAMADSIMQGILCLLVPGYSLYYLFGVTDEFYLRAIVAGLLVGIGQDAALQLKEHAGWLASIANDFISSGGGDIR